MKLPIGWLVWAALKPIIKLTFLFLVGAYSARINLITPLVSKTLTRFLLNFPFPSLFFTSILSSINVETLQKMGILLVFSVVFIGIGHFAGMLLERLLKPKKSFKNTLIMACSMGNCGDLPMAIVLSIGNSDPFNPGDASIGIAYISAYLILTNVYFFTVGLASIGEDIQVLVNEESERQINLERVIATTSSRDNTRAIVQVLHQRSSSSENAVEDQVQVEEESDGPPSITSIKDGSWKAYHKKIKLYLAKPSSKLWITCIFSPCNIAVVLGLFVALIPPLKALFYSPAPALTIQDQPPLSFIFEGLVTLSQCSVVLSIVNLGAALGSLQIKRFVGWKIAGGIAVTRLLIIPVLSIGFVLVIASTTSWIPSTDPMLRFVIMIEAVVPTAASTVYFSQYWHPNGDAQEISGVVLVQYIVCGLTLTLSLIAILSLL